MNLVSNNPSNTVSEPRLKVFYWLLPLPALISTVLLIASLWLTFVYDEKSGEWRDGNAIALPLTTFLNNVFPAALALHALVMFFPNWIDRHRSRRWFAIFGFVSALQFLWTQYFTRVVLDGHFTLRDLVWWL